VIDKIRESLANGYALKPHAGLTAGTRVRVCHGIFANTLGLVTDLRRNCTVVISLSAANQSFSLEVDMDDIEILKDAVAPAVRQPISSPQRGSRNPYEGAQNNARSRAG